MNRLCIKGGRVSQIAKFAIETRIGRRCFWRSRSGQISVDPARGAAIWPVIGLIRVKAFKVLRGKRCDRYPAQHQCCHGSQGKA